MNNEEDLKAFWNFRNKVDKTYDNILEEGRQQVISEPEKYGLSLLSEKDAEIQRLRDEAKKVSDYWSKRAAEYINEIHRLKEEVALHEKWKNDTLNDLVTYKAHKDKEIQELQAWKESATAVMPDYQKISKLIGLKLGASVPDRIIPAIEKMQAEIQHLKSSRVKDIEEAMETAYNEWFCDIDKEKNWKEWKSEYLKPFQEVNNK